MGIWSDVDVLGWSFPQMISENINSNKEQKNWKITELSFIYICLLKIYIINCETR